MTRLLTRSKTDTSDGLELVPGSYQGLWPAVSIGGVVAGTGGFACWTSNASPSSLSVKSCLACSVDGIIPSTSSIVSFSFSKLV